MEKKCTISVNCWILRNKNLDGIGYFTVNTISRIIENNPEVNFQILCDKNFSENYFNKGNVTLYKIFPPYRHPLLYFIYLKLVVPRFLKKHKSDLLIAPDGLISLNTKTKQLAVIHDINFVHYPDIINFSNRFYYNFYFKRFAKKATRICTVSEFSRNDIAKKFSVNPNKIDVVCNGSNVLNKEFSEKDKSLIRDQYTDGKNYFFFVGALHPRKNIKRLVEAFNLYKKQTNSDFKLLLIGSFLWDQTEIKNSYSQSVYKEDIIFTGRIEEEKLPSLISASFALIFVPVFEGFGVPVLEAMEYKIPVVCSNNTSLPEVAGEAAYFVNPFDINDIAKGMTEVTFNETLRNDLIKKGLLQKNKFSWQKAAEKLWDSVQIVLNT